MVYTTTAVGAAVIVISLCDTNYYKFTTNAYNLKTSVLKLK